MEEKNIFLEGKQLYLRPLKRSDLDGPYKYWFNSQEVNKYNSHHRFPHMEEENLKYYESLVQSRENIVLAIIDAKTQKHIGNVSLSSINWVDRSAEIAIMIGDKDFWGKGYGTECFRLLIDHAFGELNLHRVYCGTREDNVSLIKIAESVGMKLEGRQKEALFKDGEYYDIVNYAILSKNSGE